MTLGRTSSNAIKIKTDGTAGLRAVECACCGPKCYPVPFDSTGWAIIPTATGNNIFNRDLTAQMSFNGTEPAPPSEGGQRPFSKSSPPFSIYRLQDGDDCIRWQGTRGGYPSLEYWDVKAALFRINGIFYFSYTATEWSYEAIISSADPPYYVDNFADSSSATILGESILSIGFSSVPAFFDLHIENITISFT
jgi:hypothetical protein